LKKKEKHRKTNKNTWKNIWYTKGNNLRSRGPPNPRISPGQTDRPKLQSSSKNVRRRAHSVVSIQLK